MSTRADKYTLTDRDPQVYSDFTNNLSTHPISKNVLRYFDDRAVSNSIRNLILTGRGERLYQPNLGSGIYKMLFEPMDGSTADTLRMLIADTIAQHEPRARVLEVDVVAQYERNSYLISVKYLIINKEAPITLTITLDRVR